MKRASAIVFGFGVAVAGILTLAAANGKPLVIKVPSHVRLDTVTVTVHDTTQAANTTVQREAFIYVRCPGEQRRVYYKKDGLTWWREDGTLNIRVANGPYRDEGILELPHAEQCEVSRE